MTARYLLGMYEKGLPDSLDWSERLACAKACGFDYVELSIDESDQRLERLVWPTAVRRQLITSTKTEGIPIRSLCLSAHRKYPLGAHDTTVRGRSLQIMKQAIDLACDLGIRTIQLAGYDVYYEESTEQTRAWFFENLKRSVAYAAYHGVLLGFETMETSFMDTVEKAMVYVDKIQSPYLGVYPDIGNLSNASLLYGTSVADDIATGKGHIIAAHCKETKPGAYREIPVGTGTTDYSGALDVLVALGVRRYVAEFWYDGSPEWQADAKATAAYMRKQIDVAYDRCVNTSALL